MARRQVVEIECSRCERVERRELTDVQDDGLTFEAMLTNGPIDTASHRMPVLLVKFDDLCTPCFNTVKSHLEAIGKKIEGVSPDRSKKKEAESFEELGAQVFNELEAKKKGQAPSA